MTNVDSTTPLSHGHLGGLMRSLENNAAFREECDRNTQISIDILNECTLKLTELLKIFSKILGVDLIDRPDWTN